LFRRGGTPSGSKMGSPNGRKMSFDDAQSNILTRNCFLKNKNRRFKIPRTIKR